MEEKKEVKIIKPGESETGVIAGSVSYSKYKFWKDWSIKKKQIALLSFITLVVVALLVVSLFKLVLFDNEKSNVGVTSNVVCSNNQLKSAKSAIDKNSTDKLSKIVKDIQANNNYKNDPNCMYVVTKYYAATGDIKNMNTSLTGFYNVYDDRDGLNNILSSQPSIGVKALNDTVKQKNEQFDGVYSEIQSQL